MLLVLSVDDIEMWWAGPGSGVVPAATSRLSALEVSSVIERLDERSAASSGLPMSNVQTRLVTQLQGGQRSCGCFSRV